MEHQDYRKVTPETYGRKRYDELRALVGQGKGILTVDKGRETECLLVPLPVLGVYTVTEVTHSEIEKVVGREIVSAMAESIALEMRDDINGSTPFEDRIFRAAKKFGLMDEGEFM